MLWLNFQVDYNRHFEQISGRVEEMLFIIAQKLIFESDSWDTVGVLFQHWNAFKVIESIGELFFMNNFVV